MKQFDELIQKAKQVTLTDTEKSLMRSSISSFVNEHPIKSRASIASPYYSWFLTAKHHTFVTAFVVVFCLVGISGASAEGTLPGDTLYSMKTGVNEKVLGFFAQSKDSRAQWQLTLADRRLEESEILAKENKLTPEIKIALQSAFTDHTNNAFKTYEDSNSDNKNVSNARVMKTAEPKASVQVSLMSAMQAEPEHMLTASTASATTSITKEKIELLREQVKRAKKRVEMEREKLNDTERFIKAKGNVLMTQKLIFDSEEALRSGDTNEALKLYEDAQHELDVNDSENRQNVSKDMLQGIAK